jgi:two-component system OmpR family response regulator
MRHVRVLVVEDEERLAAAIARGLSAEGFDVDVTHDGNDGLWRAREFPYAAIVLDILLPGLNGYRVCRALRDDGVNTPILMLTAKSGEYDLADALDTGADDFLSKPFSFVVLTARLRALARRGGRPLRDPLTVGDLYLDVATRECHRADTPLRLTGREVALLEALMRRAPEIAPKRDLLDEVWGADFDGEPNIIEVYIGRLRDRIDRPFGRSSLRTVRGAGYQLVDDAAR